MDRAPTTDELLAIRMSDARLSFEEVKSYENGNIFRLDGDKETRYQDVVEMLNLCKMRGVTNVQLHMRQEPQRR